MDPLFGLRVLCGSWGAGPMKSKDLVLHVRKEFFEMIRSGEKKEEYRIMKEYWNKRFFGANAGRYDRVVIACGYPYKYDWEKWLEFPWSGVTIKQIMNPFFGPDPVTVWAIKLEEDSKT
jgi:hypothetical protein